MSNFTYIIVEGVIDVVLLTRVLRQGYGFTIIDKMSQLPSPAKDWLKEFKWPIGEDISRRAVPAPAILTKENMTIGLQNGQGLTVIAQKAKNDKERFLRIGWAPSALAVILDADNAPPLARFDEFATLLAELGYPQPHSLDKVVESGGKRSGVFAFPGQGLPGTIEDVLLPLADKRFPALSQYADEYVSGWEQQDEAKTSDDFKEFREPSGHKKARLSAIAAMLKPGKPLNASVEDQKWVPDNPRTSAALKPLMDFLDQLLRPWPLTPAQCPLTMDQ